MPKQQKPIVVFAQTPPPEHGQSRMVQLALDALRSHPEHFDVHHVNARFSETIEDIGSSSLGKGFRMIGFICKLIRLRWKLDDPLFYYVPGPAKWSAVIRDWVLLGILRIFYRKTIFHWHAIGHGEWAHGSDRLNLKSLNWVNPVARMLSRLALDRPFASICVSPTSCADSVAVSSMFEFTVCNGIEDPCPDYESNLGRKRAAALAELKASKSPHFRILFLSHGTEEKGLLDAVDALKDVAAQADPCWRFSVTFAGGVSASLADSFEHALQELESHARGRLKVCMKGYVTGEDKSHCYCEHDIFLAPSRWESFGLTVVEAMAHGMQVVAAESDGVKGVLSATHPYLAATARPDSLAACLLRCCGDIRTSAQKVDGETLRNRFVEFFQIKDFSHNLTEAMIALSKPVKRASAVPQPGDGSRNENDVRSEDAHRFDSADQKRLRKCETHNSSLHPPGDKWTNNGVPCHSLPVALSIYLADQNPGHDRSIGISRMTQSVITALDKTGKVSIRTITSRSSQQSTLPGKCGHTLPWDTRSKWMRFFTDHCHPLMPGMNRGSDIFYFPKGYLPWFNSRCRPAVVTIHDTIIQHDKDHYPRWRSRWEYGYWSWALRHTLRKVDRIMTISESSKRQIEDFMTRHRIPPKRIHVTYEPCAYEKIQQPIDPDKDNYVMHLGSREPHKRTTLLLQWWHDAEKSGRKLVPLHLIGSYPTEASKFLLDAERVIRRPFLEDSALQDAYRSARALVLPSEIEGFGLPALEAYYLGTPVCFVKGTSVEEILGVATHKGGFTLNDPESLFKAIDDVLNMSSDEIRQCGQILRETYAANKVAERMIAVFRELRTDAHPGLPQSTQPPNLQ